MRRIAPPVTDDGSKQNGAVHFAPSPLARSFRGRLQNPSKIGRDNDRLRLVRVLALRHIAEKIRNIAMQPVEIDIGRFQNDRRFRIFGQRQQGMLKRHLPVRLRVRILGRPAKRLRQVRGHRDLRKLIDDHAVNLTLQAQPSPGKSATPRRYTWGPVNKEKTTLKQNVNPIPAPFHAHTWPLPQENQSTVAS